MWSNQWLIKCHCIYAFVDFCYDNEGIQRIEASRSEICATLSLSFSLCEFLEIDGTRSDSCCVWERRKL
ncbi:hypothetical protein ACFX2A_031571 [Malus domestica]